MGDYEAMLARKRQYAKPAGFRVDRAVLNALFSLLVDAR